MLVPFTFEQAEQIGGLLIQVTAGAAPVWRKIWNCLHLYVGCAETTSVI